MSNFLLSVVDAPAPGLAPVFLPPGETKFTHPGRFWISGQSVTLSVDTQYLASWVDVLLRPRQVSYDLGELTVYAPQGATVWNISSSPILQRTVSQKWDLALPVNGSNVLAVSSGPGALALVWSPLFRCAPQQLESGTNLRSQAGSAFIRQPAFDDAGAPGGWVPPQSIAPLIGGPGAPGQLIPYRYIDSRWADPTLDLAPAHQGTGTVTAPATWATTLYSTTFQDLIGGRYSYYASIWTESASVATVWLGRLFITLETWDPNDGPPGVGNPTWSESQTLQWGSRSSCLGFVTKGKFGSTGVAAFRWRLSSAADGVVPISVPAPPNFRWYIGGANTALLDSPTLPQAPLSSSESPNLNFSLQNVIV